MERESFIKKLDKINDLPTLPAIAIEVNKMLQDYDNIELANLREKIERDQAITAKILKLANSAFFGFRSKVTSLTQAIALLGFNTIRNAIVSVSIMDALSINGGPEVFNIKDFWKHSVAVAVVSRYIAEQTKLYSPDECFIGGLLHDIGKIVMVKHFPDLFYKIFNDCEEREKSFFEVEKEESPVNHAYIGYYLAKKWQLPLKLADVIRYHHTFSRNACEYNYMIVVGGANSILELVNSSEGDIKLSIINPEVKKSLNGIIENTCEWYPELSDVIDSACSFFMDEL